MSSLKKLAISGTIWTLLGYGTSQVLRLGSNLILTRLLIPEVFGLMTLMNTLIIGLNLFSDIGITPSLIQSKRGEDPHFYNTAWTLQVIRSFCLWIAFVIMAYPVSIFYNEPQLQWLMPVIGFGSILNGFSSTSLPLLNRQIKQSKKVLFELGTQILFLVITVGWTYYSPTIWSLIMGTLISKVISTIISHRLLPEVKNYFFWDSTAIKELFSFGKWIFISTSITFLAMQIDRLLLGRLFSIEFLGIYTIAFTFADIPVQIINKINSSVVFPVVSKLKDLPRKTLRQAIINKRQLIFIVSIVLVASLTTFGDFLIIFMYDDRYEQGAWILPLLSIGIWPNLLSITMRSVQMGIGKPMYGAYGYLFKFLYMIIFLPLATSTMGMVGAIIVIALNDIPFYIIVQYGSWREGLITLKQDFQVTLLLICLIIIALVIRYSLGWGLPIDQILPLMNN